MAATTPDIVAELIRVVKAGHCAHIRYARDEAGTDLTERVIIPLKVIESVSGRVIRAIQIQPDYGTRGFHLSRIRTVSPANVPLGPAAERTKHFVANTILRLDAQSSFGQSTPTKQGPGTPSPAGFQPVACAWNEVWFREYMLALHSALLDETISPTELNHLRGLQSALGLSPDQVAAVHAYLLGQELLAMSVDGFAGEQERRHLAALQTSLNQLGWPGR